MGTSGRSPPRCRPRGRDRRPRQALPHEPVAASRSRRRRARGRAAESSADGGVHGRLPAGQRCRRRPPGERPVRAERAGVQPLAQLVRRSLEPVPVALAAARRASPVSPCAAWCSASSSVLEASGRRCSPSSVRSSRSTPLSCRATTAARSATGSPAQSVGVAGVAQHPAYRVHHVDGERVDAVVRHHRVQHQCLHVRAGGPARTARRRTSRTTCRRASSGRHRGDAQQVEVGHDVVGRVELAVVPDCLRAAAHRRRRWRGQVGEPHRLLQRGAAQRRAPVPRWSSTATR